MTILEQVAQNHGVSVEEVREDIQAAINLAWVDREGEAPDPETLISILSQIVANR